MEGRKSSAIIVTDINTPITLSYLRDIPSVSDMTNSSIFTIGDRDSGYLSSSVITTLSTPFITSNISGNLSPQRSSCCSLRSIKETNEIDANNLTPITQNIKKINDFHITTPKSEELISAGTKRSSNIMLNSNRNENTPKKVKYDNNNLQKNKPTKSANSTPRKAKRSFTKKQSFRHKLKSAPDLDLYFFNQYTENIFSPLVCEKKSTLGKRTPLSAISTNIFQASTPKSQELNNTKGVQILTNPKSSAVKRLLKFTDEQFDFVMNTVKEEEINTNDGNSENETSNNKNENSENNQKQPLIFDGNQKNHEKIQLVDVSNLNEAKPIIAFSDIVCIEKDKQETQDTTVSSDMNIPLIKPLFNPEINLKKKENNNYNIDSNECESDIKINSKKILNQGPHTPSKNNRNSIEYECFDIIYPTIPETPSKKQTINKSKIDISNKIIQKHRKFYDGVTYLNLIVKLEPYTVVLDCIFKFLTIHDLFNASQVSKEWEKIIYSNNSIKTNLKQYINECQKFKENTGFNSIINDTIKKDIIPEQKKTDKLRMPFTQINNKIDRKRSFDIQISPPVSPSKRKFHENQKIVKTLASNEKLIKCPRCQKPSRIINTQKNNDDHHKKVKFTLSDTCYNKMYPATCTLYNNKSKTNCNYNNNNSDELQDKYSRKRLIKSLSVDSALRTVNDNLISDNLINKNQFGECSGLICGYRFCLDCLCEYHPDSKCKLTAPISPSKDDIQNGILQINTYNSVSSRNIKNTRRKSLKRLCF